MADKVSQNKFISWRCECHSTQSWGQVPSAMKVGFISLVLLECPSCTYRRGWWWLYSTLYKEWVTWLQWTFPSKMVPVKWNKRNDFFLSFWYKFIICFLSYNGIAILNGPILMLSDTIVYPKMGVGVTTTILLGNDHNEMKKIMIFFLLFWDKRKFF